MSQDRPLNDVINQMNEDSSSSAENEIIVPKAKDRHLGSPSKRMPSSLKGHSLSASTSKAPGPRRRSNVGPVRGEKAGRRRSSMIPQLSPTQTEGTSKVGAARRVLIASPAKRSKRSSLTRSVNGEGRGSVRLKPIPALGLTAAPSPSMLSLADLSTEDISVSKIRPTWR